MHHLEQLCFCQQVGVEECQISRLVLIPVFFEKIYMGNCILADRGFTLKEELAALKITHFTKGRKQLSGKEVDISCQLSKFRIHVERVIGQIKKFCMLQNIVPLTQIDLLDEIMEIVCAIISLNKSIVAT